jgi:hypothetical protein
MENVKFLIGFARVYARSKRAVYGEWRCDKRQYRNGENIISAPRVNTAKPDSANTDNQYNEWSDHAG